MLVSVDKVIDVDTLDAPGGSEPVFEEFCRAVQPRLLGMLTLQYGPSVAEELTQETLARLHANWPKVATLRSPRAWVYRVAINLAASWLRRRRAERRALDRVGAAADPVPGLDRADVLAVREALARLPRGQRTTLYLRYYADLPVNEVARVMGCSPGTVTSQTRDALAALRSRGLLADAVEDRDA